MHTARHLLIYHLPLGEPDGTSVMLHRLYAACAEQVLHVSFRSGRHPPPPEFRRAHVASDARCPSTRWSALSSMFGSNSTPITAPDHISESGVHFPISVRLSRPSALRLPASDLRLPVSVLNAR